MMTLLEKTVWFLLGLVVVLAALLRLAAATPGADSVSSAPSDPGADSAPTDAERIAVPAVATGSEGSDFHSILTAPGGRFERLFGYRPPAAAPVREAPAEEEPPPPPERAVSQELAFVGRVVTDGGRTVYTFREPSTGLVFAFRPGQSRGRWALEAVEEDGFVFSKEGSGEVLIVR